MAHHRTDEGDPGPVSSTATDANDRRSFLSSLAMYTGLASAYGMFVAFAGRFLFPARPVPKAWMFVAELARMPSGASLQYVTPSGHHVSVTRLSEKGNVDDFIALSSTCPHLGCQVHWESQNSRFFCPCHNGAFDPSGTATAGPPKDAGQNLSRYPLKIENGLLFIEVGVGGGTLA
ncbi:MAG: ubiquinol-cytochrome c reductase iron-sulfur subunit [Planctomycetaceae bacterium]